jgi:4-carboxymuconolactone decarboxylase
MALFGDPELYRLGAQLRGEILGRERLEQALRDEDDLDEYYHLYGHECAYAQVWSREALPRLDRALVIAAMLAALGPKSETLRVHTRGCIRTGATRAHLRQVLAMVTWYSGVPVGSQATATMRAALQDIPEPGARQRAVNPKADATPTDLARQGRELRQRVLGEISADDDSRSEAHQAHARIQDTHYFGVLWANGDLTLRQRALVLIGVMCGSNRLHDAETWFAAALRVGCQQEEIEEVLLSAAIYCGELTYASARKALLSAVAG